MRRALGALFVNRPSAMALLGFRNRTEATADFKQKQKMRTLLTVTEGLEKMAFGHDSAVQCDVSRNRICDRRNLLKRFFAGKVAKRVCLDLPDAFPRYLIFLSYCFERL